MWRLGMRVRRQRGRVGSTRGSDDLPSATAIMWLLDSSFGVLRSGRQRFYAMIPMDVLQVPCGVCTLVFRSRRMFSNGSEFHVV